MTAAATSPLTIERSCALTAVAFSEGRRDDARLISGERRSFGLSGTRRVVQVPYPPPVEDWSLRTLTCGVALQCSPSKDRIAHYPLHELSARERAALTVVEGNVALGWVGARWPGLLPDLTRLLPGHDPVDGDTDSVDMLRMTDTLARSREPLTVHPVLGRLPLEEHPRTGFAAAAKRMYGRMPWSSPRSASVRLMSIPVGGDGGVRNPNLPPPSRPEDEEPEIRPDARVGIPYPEWNAWRDAFLPDHVAVLESRMSTGSAVPIPVAADVRRWFERNTHRAVANRLEDGSDLDIDAYLDHHIDTITGYVTDARIFRDLLPGFRDVTTALLLDGSSSLGVHGGKVFALELACADALSRAMRLARERHGIFVFSGNTRHRVEVRCLKDFGDRHLVVPSASGVTTGGYTRLGAPLRHLTRRLLDQPSERRLLLVVGDGLVSDEGYEGRYAWADVAHSVEEAEEAGVCVYYIGVGPARVDPLPEVFGPARSQRIHRVEDLPQVLAHVHRELVTE
ncbi:nitric oxide reductase activation protein NorD [Rhodococcus sp. NPDC060090]|uniref:nitric oxide reductase activation protein NorD n=1 Tax=Rhodococcus sp. NPDC060090 TaxID=3347056 RepID=UPI00364BD140